MVQCVPVAQNPQKTARDATNRQWRLCICSLASVTQTKPRGGVSGDKSSGQRSEARRRRHTIAKSYHSPGVSALRGRQKRTGGLARFLAEIEAGTIKPGEWLLVESIDRLSREKISEAEDLIKRILSAGITIATLSPEQILTPEAKDDLLARIEILVLASRANEESETKSRHGKDVRDARRATAGTPGQPKMTASCPAWLRLSADRTKWEEIPEAVSLVRRVFSLTIAGHGAGDICKTFLVKGVPALGRRANKSGKPWNKSYIQKILRSRAVLGEHQCYEGGRGCTRKPVGEPIKAYYPRIIDEATWHKAQAATASRKGKPGRQGEERIVNIFTGLIRDSHDGANMVLKRGQDKGRWMPYTLVSTLALRGTPGSVYLSFPYAAFEESVLLALSEIKAADIVPNTQKQLALSDTLARLEGQRAEVAGKIAKTKKRLANEPDFDELADVLKTLATSHKSLCQQIEDLRGQLHATPHKETLGSIKTAYIAHADATPEELPELRLRLKQSIRDLIAEIWVQVEARPGQERSALVDLHFHSGTVRAMQIVTQKGKLWGSNYIADAAMKGKGWGLKAAFIKDHADPRKTA